MAVPMLGRSRAGSPWLKSREQPCLTRLLRKTHNLVGKDSYAATWLGRYRPDLQCGRDTHRLSV